MTAQQQTTITIGKYRLGSLDGAFDAIEKIVKDHFRVKDLTSLSIDEKRTALRMMVQMGVTNLRFYPNSIANSLAVSRAWVYLQIEQVSKS